MKHTSGQTMCVRTATIYVYGYTTEVLSMVCNFFAPSDSTFGSDQDETSSLPKTRRILGHHRRMSCKLLLQSCWLLKLTRSRRQKQQKNKKLLGLQSANDVPSSQSTSTQPWPNFFHQGIVLHQFASCQFEVSRQ